MITIEKDYDIRYNIGTKMERIVQKRYEKRGAPLDFMMYPTTVKTLAAEINNACDAYISRKIGTEELRKLILHYAENYPDMLFNTQDLNPTVLNRIGKKRTNLVNKMLQGYQQKL